MINPKTVTNRRPLRFSTMDDLLADIEAIDARTSHTGGTASGNWTPAQLVRHVTDVIDGALDGFTIKAPLPIRLLVRLVKKRALTHPMKPGIKLPANMKSFLPPPETTWPDAVYTLQTSIGRIQHGEKMTHPSPVFGPFTHEQWTQLHCRHAELHFSFLSPGPPPE